MALQFPSADPHKGSNMSSKDLLKRFRNKVVGRYTSHEGCKKISKALKIPQNTVKGMAPPTVCHNLGVHQY